ncbi:hypothetical protein [Streptomyces sp. NBC_01445]|uniref:hypothetical protein n=1 Tax=Streptomyces sp. NBC_01445 TaxID=2903869 RepID=UPI002DDB4E64|nr:hypothetical protein [Streptomyces sp. NBC_01445]WSE02059.1 hypothetical protein OG574_00605 [Streptomyces sp. NBC_01445]WSE10271.1 hypothetical protein OG574_47405 [Streptomyces sp. NBC_01445]WSE11160.1 hypothetical protein OG574_48615 [Streptomyces sp. NBC_01445]
MEPLPTPCPADRIPDATGMDAFNAACKAAKEQRVVFIAVEQQGPQWAVKADALTAPQHTIPTTAHDAVREAVARLIRSREIRPDSSAGPVDFVLHDVDSEGLARELAAALHAALYGDLEPLARAVSPTS